MSATEGEIYSWFDLDFTITKYLEDLHKFRLKVADIFSLADKDNDNALYHVFDELEEFWQIMDDEIEAITDPMTRSNARPWFIEIKKQFD